MASSVNKRENRRGRCVQATTGKASAVPSQVWLHELTFADFLGAFTSARCRSAIRLK